MHGAHPCNLAVMFYNSGDHDGLLQPSYDRFAQAPVTNLVPAISKLPDWRVNPAKAIEATNVVEIKHRSHEESTASIGAIGISSCASNRLLPVFKDDHLWLLLLCPLFSVSALVSISTAYPSILIPFVQGCKKIAIDFLSK